MAQITNFKRDHYDLEERTFLFALRADDYANRLPRTISNIENGSQLLRAAGAVGANYIESIESLSKKNFKIRIQISKKKTREARFWLRLTEPSHDKINEKECLIHETSELMKLFCTILKDTKI